MAVPDHPWSKASPDAAAVRISMTVGEAGSRDGVLREVTREAELDTDTPVIELVEHEGLINSDLTVGVDVTSAVPLKANEGVCSPGVKLHGDGFIVTPAAAAYLGLGTRPGLENHIREYRNGRDLTARSRGVMVIDLFGLDADEVRARFPEVYQHLTLKVKAVREAIAAKSGTKDAASYATLWLVFGKPRSELRPALVGLQRYFVTPVTQKHRVFQFLDSSVIADDALMVFALPDAWLFGVMHSSIFAVWFAETASSLEDRPRFIKSDCFDPFPFPAASDTQKAAIRAIAEKLDVHRKNVLAGHPHLTLTGLYNVLEKLRARTAPDALDADDRRIFDDGLVLILKEHHDALDSAVADAYGWPADLSDDDILARLVALNAERAKEEKRGLVRWLRPEYQIPKFGSPKEKQEQLEATLIAASSIEQKPSYPTDDMAQTAMVMAALANASAPLDAAAIASGFRQGQRIAPKVVAVLTALARMGVISTGDGGKTFALRRVA